MSDLRLSSWSASSAIPAEDWQALAADATIYSSLGWLGIREEELPATANARYSMVSDHDGPVAGLTSYSFTGAPHKIYDPRTFLNEIVSDEELPSYLDGEFVIGSGWSEFRGEILRRPNVAHGFGRAVDLLVRDAVAWTDSRKAPLLAFLFLPLQDARAICESLPGDAVPVLHDFETVLPTSWSSFDDYLAWLPRELRRQARRELRKFASSGRDIEEARLDEVVDEIAPLNSALMRKYGHDFSPERAREVYGRQARYLADRSSVLISRDGDKPVGFVLRYLVGSRAYARVVGRDYEVENAGEYFILNFYEAVRYGIKNSVDTVHLGLGTLEAKMGRGAQPVPLYHVFVDPSGRLPSVRPLTDQLSRDRLERFQRENAKWTVGPLDTSTWLPGQW